MDGREGEMRGGRWGGGGMTVIWRGVREENGGDMEGCEEGKDV